MFKNFFKFRKKIRKYFSLLFIFSFTSLPILSNSKFNQFTNLKEFSKSVTIGIETPGSSGSGVIIGKKNNKYLFITAKHVANIKPSHKLN